MVMSKLCEVMPRKASISLAPTHHDDRCDLQGRIKEGQSVAFVIRDSSWLARDSWVDRAHQQLRNTKVPRDVAQNSHSWSRHVLCLAPGSPYFWLIGSVRSTERSSELPSPQSGWSQQSLPFGRFSTGAGNLQLIRDIRPDRFYREQSQSFPDRLSLRPVCFRLHTRTKVLPDPLRSGGFWHLLEAVGYCIPRSLSSSSSRQRN
jgi:hypothetical protein